MLIGDSLPEYIFIRGAVFALRLVAPVSLACCSTFFITRPLGLRYQRWMIPIGLWMAAESVFFTCVYIPLRYTLQREAHHPEPLPMEDRQTLIGRCIDRVPQPEIYLSKWLLDSPRSEIKRENVKEFYAWSLMDKPIESADDAELDLYTDQLEDLLGRKLKGGRGNARSLNLTLDPVPMQHRPLLWYAIVSVVECYTVSRLLWNSFHFHRASLTRSLATFPLRLHPFFTWARSPSPMVSYWLRAHTSKSKSPVLFIHGIGVGLYTYVDFLVELSAAENMPNDGDIGVLALEILPISSRICPPALSAAEMKREIWKILDAHKWTEIVLVGHSYGTGIAANILRDPELSKYVKAAVLLDPICFMLHLPGVAYNFTRRKPSKASEHMLHYFSSQDMMISHTLARRFFWKECVLFKDDIPPSIPLTVTLSGQDLIVPTSAVWDYVTDAPMSMGNEDEHPKDDAEWQDTTLKVLWFGKFNHASLFNSKGARRGLALTIRNQCNKSQSIAQQTHMDDTYTD